MNHQEKQCKEYAKDQGYKWVCHHRALLAHNVLLCKIEKGTQLLQELQLQPVPVKPGLDFSPNLLPLLDILV